VELAQAGQILYQHAGQPPGRGGCEGAPGREAGRDDEGDVYAKVVEPKGSHPIGGPSLCVASGHQAVGSPTRPQPENRFDAHPPGLERGRVERDLATRP
jgi:hypothetical protein